jgi:hypothetical protein
VQATMHRLMWALSGEERLWVYCCGWYELQGHLKDRETRVDYTSVGHGSQW